MSDNPRAVSAVDLLHRLAAQTTKFRDQYQLKRRPLSDLAELIQTQLDAIRARGRNAKAVAEGPVGSLERIVVFALIALERQAAPAGHRLQLTPAARDAIKERCYMVVTGTARTLTHPDAPGYCAEQFRSDVLGGWWKRGLDSTTARQFVASEDEVREWLTDLALGQGPVGSERTTTSDGTGES